MASRLPLQVDHRAMKVLDLQCAKGHGFEGWFASEEDFQTQHQKAMVQCPLCGDHTVVKRPSAPRLSLGGHRAEHHTVVDVVNVPPEPASGQQALAAAWMSIARKLIANTTDVGNQFADEARKMHYGESDERGIRGQATLDETRALLDEGIDVMPLMLPEALKQPLQ